MKMTNDVVEGCQLKNSPKNLCNHRFENKASAYEDTDDEDFDHFLKPLKTASDYSITTQQLSETFAVGSSDNSHLSIQQEARNNCGKQEQSGNQTMLVDADRRTSNQHFHPVLLQVQSTANAQCATLEYRKGDQDLSLSDALKLEAVSHRHEVTATVYEPSADAPLPSFLRHMVLVRNSGDVNNRATTTSTTTATSSALFEAAALGLDVSLSPNNNRSTDSSGIIGNPFYVPNNLGNHSMLAPTDANPSSGEGCDGVMLVHKENADCSTGLDQYCTDCAGQFQIGRNDTSSYRTMREEEQEAEVDHTYDSTMEKAVQSGSIVSAQTRVAAAARVEEAAARENVVASSRNVNETALNKASTTASRNRTSSVARTTTRLSANCSAVGGASAITARAQPETADLEARCGFPDIPAAEASRTPSNTTTLSIETGHFASTASTTTVIKTTTTTTKTRDENHHHSTPSASSSLKRGSGTCASVDPAAVLSIHDASKNNRSCVVSSDKTATSDTLKPAVSSASRKQRTEHRELKPQQERERIRHQKLEQLRKLRLLQKEQIEEEQKKKELARQKKLEEESRLHQLQCTFPVVNKFSYKMPPTNGRQISNDVGGGSNNYNNHQQQQQRRRPTSSSSIGSGANVRSVHDYHNIVNNNNTISDNDNTSNNDGSRKPQPTPLFERLVTEEVQELKAYARIIEGQQRRLAELERVHGDLEARLEVESRGRQHLEATLEAREREWSKLFEELKNDRDQWKEVVTVEQSKNARLYEQVMRKDQAIQSMLVRKYDNDGGRSVRNLNRHLTASERGADRHGSSKSPETRTDYHKSPHEILAASGSAEKVRLRNVESLLLDFFGM